MNDNCMNSESETYLWIDDFGHKCPFISHYDELLNDKFP